MALPNRDPLSNAPAPVTVTTPIMAPLPQAGGVPMQALARLPRLHAESRQILSRASFLNRAVPAAGTVLAMGVAAALAGGGNLAPTFVWSLLIWLGVGAVLRNHLRTAPFGKDIAAAAADLKAILVYLGCAWGAGDFLALAPGAPALLLFAGAPILVLTAMLGIRALAFTLPVTVLSLAAALTRDASLAAAIGLVLLQASAALLAHRAKARDAGFSAGLAAH